MTSVFVEQTMGGPVSGRVRGRPWAWSDVAGEVARQSFGLRGVSQGLALTVVDLHKADAALGEARPADQPLRSGPRPYRRGPSAAHGRCRRPSVAAVAMRKGRLIA